MPVVLLEAGGPLGDSTEVRIDFDDMLQNLWYATEVWRAVDVPDILNAELVEMVHGTTFRDWPSEPGNYYYWMRLVSPSGQRGEFSDPLLIEIL